MRGLNPECDGLNQSTENQYRAAFRIVSGVDWHNDLHDQDSDTYRQLERQLKEMVSSLIHQNIGMIGCTCQPFVSLPFSGNVYSE